MKWWTFFSILTLIVIGFYFINPYKTATLDPRARILGFTPYYIPSSSMKPTLVEGDYILVKTFSLSSQQPIVKDVITYKAPHNDMVFVGRVIAKPGDTVAVIDSTAVVNGVAQTESYILKQPEGCDVNDFDKVTVPEHAFFIMGDNRCNSYDSRFFGFVSQSNLIGKAVYIWMSEDEGRIGGL